MRANEFRAPRPAGAAGPRVPIIRHPDVRRMLLLMKSQTEAMRALAAVAAVSLDAARLHPNAEERARHQAFVDLMIPVIKGWCTENSVDIASLGIQVHGGVGFVEETGAAQYLRDARITPIYEGTTGIQANDLIGRKLARDGGHAAQAVIAQMRTLAGELGGRAEFVALPRRYFPRPSMRWSGRFATWWRTTPPISAASPWAPCPCSSCSASWPAAGSCCVRRRSRSSGSPRPRRTAPMPAFYEAKILTARFYADHVLSQAPGLSHSIVHGAAAALAEGVL